MHGAFLKWLTTRPISVINDSMVAAEEASSRDFALREEFVGVERKVPIAGGRERVYINFDNAASTPPLRSVVNGLNSFADWYSSVHRGAGHKSRLATAAFEEARDVVARFVGADPGHQDVIFVKHTTEAVNKVARKLQQEGNYLVLSTLFEHHSNMLPWRHRTRAITIPPNSLGLLDVDEVISHLRACGGAVKLVAVTGASNVTGYMPPIHEIAEAAHRAGARIFVDAAQLAPHHPIDVRSPDDPGHLDFVAFSGHKMYAPYGSGVLISPRGFFDSGVPDQVGGGAVRLVTDDDTVWAEGPSKEEAGSPNVMGAVALAHSIRWLQTHGLDRLLEHELALRQRLTDEIQDIPGVRILGGRYLGSKNHLGIVTLEVLGLHHSLAAAALSWEWGIGVRSGCFCAQPYLARLLQLDAAQIAEMRKRIIDERPDLSPGGVRVSFAPYNTFQEVDVFTEALEAVMTKDLDASYDFNPETGDMEPVEGFPKPPSLFDLT